MPIANKETSYHLLCKFMLCHATLKVFVPIFFDGSCMYDISGCMYGGSNVGDSLWWAASPYSTGAIQPGAATNYLIDCAGATVVPNIDDGCCEWDCCDEAAWFEQDGGVWTQGLV